MTTHREILESRLAEIEAQVADLNREADEIRGLLGIKSKDARRKGKLTNGVGRRRLPAEGTNVRKTYDAIAANGSMTRAQIDERFPGCCKFLSAYACFRNVRRGLWEAVPEEELPEYRP